MTLRACGVVVRAGGATLLEGVDITVEAGEVVAIVGPNGAGKSTLLRALAGDRPVDAGSVEMDGRPLRSWSLAERALRRAVVGADDEPVFSWRVAELVTLGRIPQHGGNPGPRDHAIVARLLADVDARHLADRVHATLSSGERQRVALARALAQVWPAALAPEVPWPGPGSRTVDPAPAWLLLDEPTSNLDLRHQAMTLRLLRARAAQGAGVLIVLHDLNLAAAHADRIVVLAAGRVAAVGAPDEILRPELLDRVFEVPMLLLRHPDLPHPLAVPAPEG